MSMVTRRAAAFSLEGVANGDFTRVSLDDYRDKWVVLFFYPLDFTFVCPTEILEFDRKLAEFTSRHEPRALMERLQAAGVPAGMVQRSSDQLEDPQLRHRRFFRPLAHPEMGEVPYEGHQFIISGYDSGPRMPAPCLGEHSIQVLQEILVHPPVDACLEAAQVDRDPIAFLVVQGQAQALARGQCLVCGHGDLR